MHFNKTPYSQEAESRKMIIKFKKTISILTIVFLVFFQTVTVSAIEIPTPPPQPEAPALETQSAVPPAPEAPTPPEIPTIEPSPEPTPPQEEENTLSESGEGDQALETSGQEDLQTLNEEPAQVVSNLSGLNSNGEVGDAVINTGGGLTSGSLTNIANSNTALESPGTNSPNTSAVAENSGNGSNSINSASVDNESNSNVIQDNSADIGNNLNLDTNTGESSASQNAGNSSVETGDANTSGTLVNIANTNLAGLAVSEFNVADDQKGDLVLDFTSGCIVGCEFFDPASTVNTGNGSNSANDSEVNQTVTNNTFQYNEGTLENNVTLEANSGDNQADKNTGGDSTITTGDANVAANVVNFLNNNIAGNVILGVVNIFGDLIGDIILPEEAINMPLAGAANIGNGSDSTNSALIDNTINNITAQTNDALIQNNLNFQSNTGGNQTSQNTGGNSSIETGEANINSQTLNIANSNISGGDWWLVLVNEAGEWAGKILGAPDGSNIAGSAGTQISDDPNGNITVTNQNNDSDSQNTASTGQTVNNNTVQNNVAQIINNLNLFANTGNNSVSKNTGGDSSIKTGDASVIANLVNFVNNNISGNGRLTVVVVNVFGSWLGDFVTPGHEKEKPTAAEESNDQASSASSSNFERVNSDKAAPSDSNHSGDSPGNNSIVLNTPIIPANEIAGKIIPPSIAGIFTENPAPEIQPNDPSQEVLTMASEITPEGKTSINLAWGLLFIPFAIVMYVLKIITPKASLTRELIGR